MSEAVIDTNILVSGLLRASSPPGRILDLILSDELRPVFDDRIFLEYRQVLTRPAFGFQDQDVADLLEYLEYSGTRVVASPLIVNIPDRNDLPFLEVAIQAKIPLITGNPRHFPQDILREAGVRLFTAAEYLEQPAK